jgi:hypothetical protein
VTGYSDFTKPYKEAVKFRCVARATVFQDEIKEEVRRKYWSNLPTAAFERYWKARVPSPQVDPQQAISSNFRYMFDDRDPPYAPGRFNTEAFPALYTAKSADTARAERFHYAMPSKPFEYVIYSVLVTGEVVDLRPLQDARTLELSNDHANCRAIAEDIHDRFAGVAWFSVREDGSCCAFFTCDGIVADAIEEEGTHLAPGTA